MLLFKKDLTTYRLTKEVAGEEEGLGLDMASANEGLGGFDCVFTKRGVFYAGRTAEQGLFFESIYGVIENPQQALNAILDRKEEFSKHLLLGMGIEM